MPSATKRGDTLTLAEAQAHLCSTGELLAATGPTAVNLFWAIERMQLCAQQAIREQYTIQALARHVKAEALAIADEDFVACLSMGSYGAGRRGWRYIADAL